RTSRPGGGAGSSPANSSGPGAVGEGRGGPLAVGLGRVVVVGGRSHPPVSAPAGWRPACPADRPGAGPATGRPPGTAPLPGRLAPPRPRPADALGAGPVAAAVAARGLMGQAAPAATGHLARPR